MFFVLLAGLSVAVSCWHKKLSYKDICAEQVNEKEVNIVLFLFLSKDNCSDCLHSVFHVLKKLPSYFYCYGIVREENSSFLPDYFDKIGFKVKIIERQKLADRSAHIYPSLAGYNKNGNLLFVLPLAYANPQILEEYLYSLYYNNASLHIE
jgi:hypothetical protein